MTWLRRLRFFLSVRPLRESEYLGGAAIVAAHLRGLGARVHLLTALSSDPASRKLVDRLSGTGIHLMSWQRSAPVPTKERYFADTQKLLKVDRGYAQPLDSAIEGQLSGALGDVADDLDAVVFCDYGYGLLSHSLLSRALPVLRPRVGTIAGDVSGPRRTLLDMADFDLLTPTERELRAVSGDFEVSLPGVAMRLMRKLRVANLAVTMGHRGCVLFRPREGSRDGWFGSRLRSEYVPSLSGRVVDTVGAGDAFLAAATLALAFGSGLNRAGYVGAAAAGLELERLGNEPVDTEALLGWLRFRPELRDRANSATA